MGSESRIKIQHSSSSSRHPIGAQGLLQGLPQEALSKGPSHEGSRPKYEKEKQAVRHLRHPQSQTQSPQP